MDDKLDSSIGTLLDCEGHKRSSFDYFIWRFLNDNRFVKIHLKKFLEVAANGIKETFRAGIAVTIIVSGFIIDFHCQLKQLFAESVQIFEIVREGKELAVASGSVVVEISDKSIEVFDHIGSLCSDFQAVTQAAFKCPLELQMRLDFVLRYRLILI